MFCCSQTKPSHRRKLERGFFSITNFQLRITQGIKKTVSLRCNSKMMQLEKYSLASSDKMMTFEFVSEGNKGLIHKLVRYQPTNLRGVYNLAFGDKDHATGNINDTIISNNGDSEKVLATVAATVYAFTDKYPETWIYATGSTKSRTRLYRMGITKFLDEAQVDFEILGERNEDWENFKKDMDYNGFLIKRRNNN